MNDIPFDKNFDLVPGQVDEVMPGVRRILCNNPSPFTFKGTVSYIVGRGKVAIIDPGPDDAAHSRGAARRRARRDRDAHLRHPHPSRSFAAPCRAIKAATGAHGASAKARIAPRGRSHVGEAPRLDAANDTDFRPTARSPTARSSTATAGPIEAVTTPGHTANHMAFALREAHDALFSGDHVMAWSTPVVAPPDGAMGDYMASLAKLAKRDEPIYFPGHGAAVRNAPRFVAAYILHRKAREASIVEPPRQGRDRHSTDGRAIYIGLDPRLVRAAGLSVLAHLEDLVARGAVRDRRPAVDRGPLSLGRLSWPLACRSLPAWRLGLRGRLLLVASASLRARIRLSRCPRAGSGCARHWCRNRGGRSARPSARRCARRRGVGRTRSDDVVAEAHDRGARHRLDLAVAAAGLRRAVDHHAPLALVDRRRWRRRRRSAGWPRRSAARCRDRRRAAARRRRGRRSRRCRAGAAARSRRSAADRSGRW